MFVQIVNEDGSILKKPASFIKGKTVSNILEKLPQTRNNSFLLGIKTPAYIKILKPFAIPYENYPSLIQKDSEDSNSFPDYALQILNISELGKLFFLLKPISTNNPNIDINFPPFIYGFNPSNYTNLKISHLISDIKAHFGLDIANPSLYLNKMEIFPEESFITFYHKFSNYVKNCLINRRTEKLEPIEFHFEIEGNGIRKIQKRENKLKEIFTSEKTYLRTLIELRYYFSPNFNKYKILNENDHKTYFEPISQMIKTSSDLINELRTHQKYSSCISSVFLRFVSELKKSSQKFYLNYHLKIASHVRTIEKNPQVEQLCNSASVNCCMDFSSIIFQLIQRPPRYRSLLSDILNLTPKSHPDFHPLHLAWSQVNQMVNELDREFMVHGMDFIEERLADSSGKRSIISPTRIFKENFCVILKEKNKMTCNLYLFNDLILLTTSTRKEIELMRTTYDKFFFIPNFPDDISITCFFNNEYKCIDFSSKDEIQRFQTELTKNRKNFLDSIPQIEHPSIKATEFYPPNNHTVPQMIDCSCIKSGNIINVLSGRNLITFTTDKELFEVNENVKKIKPHSKIVDVNGRKFVYGGLKCNSPIELFENKGKIEPKNANLELMGKINAKKINALKEGRIFHTCCSYKDYIVVFGGMNPKTMKKVYSDVYFYSIENCEWYLKKSKNKPDARYKHSAVIYKDRMIIYGGINLNNHLMNDTWSFSFETGEWTRIDVVCKDCVTARFGHSAVVVDNLMFVIGGTTSKSGINYRSIHFGHVEDINSSNSENSIVMIANEDSFDEPNFQTTDSNENDSSDLNDFGENDEFYLSSMAMLSNDCFAASGCFCLDLESGKAKKIEVAGNFLSGLSLFASCYDESSKRIIVFGGTDSKSLSQKGNPIVTFLEISSKVSMDRVELSGVPVDLHSKHLQLVKDEWKSAPSFVLEDKLKIGKEELNENRVSIGSLNNISNLSKTKIHLSNSGDIERLRRKSNVPRINKNMEFKINSDSSDESDDNDRMKMKIKTEASLKKIHPIGIKLNSVYHQDIDKRKTGSINRTRIQTMPNPPKRSSSTQTRDGTHQRKKGISSQK